VGVGGLLLSHARNSRTAIPKLRQLVKRAVSSRARTRGGTTRPSPPRVAEPPGPIGIAPVRPSLGSAAPGAPVAWTGLGAQRGDAPGRARSTLLPSRQTAREHDAPQRPGGGVEAGPHLTRPVLVLPEGRRPYRGHHAGAEAIRCAATCPAAPSPAQNRLGRCGSRRQSTPALGARCAGPEASEGITALRAAAAAEAESSDRPPEPCRGRAQHKRRTPERHPNVSGNSAAHR
jgi:hypothetical protein